MRMLFCTQKVDKDDDVLAFVHDWIEALSVHAESITVVSLGVGTVSLPKNVTVVSLGKERGAGRARMMIRFLLEIIARRREYDSVFVHMSVEFALLGGLLWRLWGRRVVLWYTHRAVHLRLRIAHLLSNAVATAAPQSYGITSSKVHILGHGIKTARFANPAPRAQWQRPLKLVSVGRITPIKHLDTIIRALGLLAQGSIEARLTLVGAPAVPSDRAYERELKELIDSLGLRRVVEFVGSVPNHAIAHFYHEADIAINACPTGGIDKAVLEAMSAGTPTLVANEAFRPYFGEDAERLVYTFDDEHSLARAIEALARSSDREALASRVIHAAEQHGGLERLAQRLATLLETPYVRH